jgi:hypothetical protein
MTQPDLLQQYRVYTPCDRLDQRGLTHTHTAALLLCRYEWPQIEYQSQASRVVFPCTSTSSVDAAAALLQECHLEDSKEYFKCLKIRVLLCVNGYEIGTVLI